MIRQLVTINSVSMGSRGVVCRINIIAMLTHKAVAVLYKRCLLLSPNTITFIVSMMKNRVDLKQPTAPNVQTSHMNV